MHLNNMKRKQIIYMYYKFCQCYAGLPNRNGNKHVAEVANFAMALLKMIMDKQYTISGKRMVKLRIGINSGRFYIGVIYEALYI